VLLDGVTVVSDGVSVVSVVGTGSVVGVMGDFGITVVGGTVVSDGVSVVSVVGTGSVVGVMGDSGITVVGGTVVSDGVSVEDVGVTMVSMTIAKAVPNTKDKVMII